MQFSQPPPLLDQVRDRIRAYVMNKGGLGVVSPLDGLSTHKKHSKKCELLTQFLRGLQPFLCRKFG